MRKLFLLSVVLCLVVGCSTREPIIKYEIVEVKVPIQVRATAPPALLAPIKSPLPVFIPPKAPEASSALSTEGEERLKRLLIQHRDRELAWATFYQAN